MMIGTLYFMMSSMSCSSRLFERCTIWLIANGAAGLSGCFLLYASNSSVISCSHSSNCDEGRAFNAGMEPTMPALHCSMTSFGLLMMNIGEAITGMRKFRKFSGKCSIFLSFLSIVMYASSTLHSILDDGSSKLQVKEH